MTTTKKLGEARESEEYSRTLRFLAEFFDEIRKPGQAHRTYDMVAQDLAHRMGMNGAQG